MTKTSSPLLDRSIMPLAELFALVLDGQLYRVGDSFATQDTADTPALRAAAFATHRPGAAVADRETAAWIHGTRRSPPARPQVCVDRERRGRLSSEFDAHQHALGEGDTITLAGVRVTTPLRTAADLLLTLPAFDKANAIEAQHLLVLAGASISQLREQLSRFRRVGAPRAVQRLAEVERARLPFPSISRL